MDFFLFFFWMFFNANTCPRMYVMFFVAEFFFPSLNFRAILLLARTHCSTFWRSQLTSHRPLVSLCCVPLHSIQQTKMRLPVWKSWAMMRPMSPIALTSLRIAELFSKFWRNFPTSKSPSELHWNYYPSWMLAFTQSLLLLVMKRRRSLSPVYTFNSKPTPVNDIQTQQQHETKRK